ncbi:MAG: TlyA family RNA methyltransferase [Actinomycetota bacterium]|nr:TlyA family RNA methyltransferase [Actinomycetota bacterium]
MPGRPRRAEARGGPELAARRRLDVELVTRGLASSRSEAGALVAASRVLVAGAVAEKTSRQVSSSEPLVVTEPLPRFASRGGEKLDAALRGFGVEVKGKEALDAGTSTGGFTDCLLQWGASRVVAVDVGRGQLLARLRADPRVEVMEGRNIRYLSPEDVGGRRFDIVVADLSFISLTMVAGALVGLARPGADLVVLVKPQFEAGKALVSRGRGVVRDAGAWAGALRSVADAFVAAGAGVVGAMASPLLGTRGNTEFFLHVCPGEGDAAAMVNFEEVALSALASAGAPR